MRRCLAIRLLRTRWLHWGGPRSASFSLQRSVRLFGSGELCEAMLPAAETGTVRVNRSGFPASRADGGEAAASAANATRTAAGIRRRRRSMSRSWL